MSDQRISFILLTKVYDIRLEDVLRSVKVNSVDQDEFILFINKKNASDFPQKFLKQFNKVICHGLQGCGEIRKSAVMEADSELIAFIDDDTLLEPTWRAASLKQISLSSVAFTQPKQPFPHKNMFEIKFNSFLIYFFDTAGSLMKKSAIIKAGNFDPRLFRGEDSELATRIIYNGWDVAISDTVIRSLDKRNSTPENISASAKADAFMNHRAGMRFGGPKNLYDFLSLLKMVPSLIQRNIWYQFLTYYYLLKITSQPSYRFHQRRENCVFVFRDNIHLLSAGTRMIFSEEGIRFIHLSPCGKISAQTLSRQNYTLDQEKVLFIKSAQDISDCLYQAI